MMNWFLDMLRASIGKKLLMALTGAGFCFFLLIHLFGNLTIFGGKVLFETYVARLHSLGLLVAVAEFGLLICALVHVSTGLILFWGNMKARPVKYQMNHRAGGRTIGSATMPYTGLIILGFVIVHLLNFHFIDPSRQTVFQAVKTTFSLLPYVFFYVLAVIIVAIHVSHGFWSLFQTLGANHPKYMPLIRRAGIAFSVVIATGFGFIPVYIRFIA